jgi:hypothetical protein
MRIQIAFRPVNQYVALAVQQILLSKSCCHVAAHQQCTELMCVGWWCAKKTPSLQQAQTLLMPFALFLSLAVLLLLLLLRLQDRIRIACETVSALVFLHSAPEPIIHMDLKPGNLLINRSLLCKVRQQHQQQHQHQEKQRLQVTHRQAASARSLCWTI